VVTEVRPNYVTIDLLQLIFALAIAVPPLVQAGSIGAAAIVNSGSTNAPGFRVEVQRSGGIKYIPTPRSVGPASETRLQARQGRVPEKLARRFYSDLSAAQPFTSLPKPDCMKSASFGYTLLIQLGNERSPDLTCGDGDNAKLRALIRDVNEILNLAESK
jgi:hypothetical protein